MKNKSRLFILLIVCFSAFNVSVVFAQAAKEAPAEKKRIGAVYFSWGYNSEWYTRSTVHVKQQEYGNDYDLVSVHARDHKGWNNKSIFRQPVTIPQYNYRLGFYINKKYDLAFEINFDHTKYLIADSQFIRVKGKLNGVTTDETILFSEKTGFYYFLNNGANFLLFNLVKRVGLYHTRNNNLFVDLNTKAGIGPVIPHVENKLFGRVNNQGFQFGGWNTGIETALRVTVMKYGFLEFSQKVDYARYSNLRVASGRASQNFGTYELIMSAGFIFPTSKHNPRFERKSSSKKD